MLIPYINKLCAEIDKKISRLEKELGEGKAADFPDYKKRTGQIAGLNEAKKIAQNTAKRLSEDDDDFYD